MTLDQGLAFGLIGVTVLLFIWGRLPYDLVALLSLVAGVALGLVPASKAFDGFADDVVIIVASALVISSAVSRSGVVESAMRPLLPYLRKPSRQVPALAGAVMGLSVFTKNIGALAIFMPVALQLGRKTGTPASLLMMPMSFASLIGGLVTLVGTSTNIIVAKVRADVTGQPFGMFDFTPVGLGLAAAGLAFLAVGYRLLPRDRRPAGSLAASFRIEAYTTEACLPDDSPLVGATVGELEALGDGDVTVATVIRERFRRFVPGPDWRLSAGDVLLLDGEPEDLERLVARAKLTLVGTLPAAGEATVIEAVIPDGSALVGTTAAGADLAGHHGTTLLAVSRSGAAITRRIGSVRLRAGDVVVLRAAQDRLGDMLSEFGLLPLAERKLALGHSRRSYIPIAVLAGAMALIALHVVPVAMAFFGAAVLLLVLRVMTMHEAYETIEWPVIVLLGALIPVSDAVRTTGGTDLIAGALSNVMHTVPPMLAIGLLLIAAMAVTPFLNNAATVLVMGPIGASLAQKLGLNPDPFLMAVSVGAACDFLTPIGHQCNTLVMGPGGYRFGDYARLGLPLSIMVIVVGTLLITVFWPVAPR
ncbi:SLC13 family permease [Methylobacterium sp. yr596]|uniref:SLC13 family permease n=1 Tax=Methylobacterium sp. yr596 TaxID=1761800 RepID=UPI0008EF6BFA|nr:SLC13 family permease [Methylobacterium sp. yr596]SFE11426.1 Di-and tricarboxylate transporter [Methylobacterium sp. yr596]